MATLPSTVVASRGKVMGGVSPRTCPLWAADALKNSNKVGVGVPGRSAPYVWNAYTNAWPPSAPPTTTDFFPVKSISFTKTVGFFDWLQASPIVLGHWVLAPSCAGDSSRLYGGFAAPSRT